MKTTDFLRLTDGVDEAYLAETVRTGMTARGKDKTAEPAFDAESTEVFTMTNTSSKFSFFRPVLAGILTVIAAGGAAAWLFIGLPKLRQNPGTNPGESSTATELPDLSALGIDTSRFVRAEEPYMGGDTLGFYLTDVQTDSTYQWCYDSPRPAEAWVRFDAENGDRIILDGQNRLRRYRRAVRAAESTKPGLDAAVRNANAFAQAVTVGTVPEITVGADDATDHAYSASFYSDEIWGFGDMDAEGTVVEWYADYANMDGKTADTAEFDRAAAPLLDFLAVGQLDSGEKWQIIKRRFISMNGKVYGLYDVLMGNGEIQSTPYGTHYFMIDAEQAFSTDTAIQPADLAALGIDMATYQKNDAPYNYSICDLYNLNGDMQFPSRYGWCYPYAQPRELWDEYRGANGEQLVFDQQGNLRRFRSSSEMPESKAPLSEEELKARGETLLQALLPGCKLSSPKSAWSEGGYKIEWDASDGSVYRSGTIYLNASGDIWYIVNDCYVLQSVADTGKYDQSAYTLSETGLEPAVPADAVEITDRFFIAFGGKVYGCYTLDLTTANGISTQHVIIDANDKGTTDNTDTAIQPADLTALGIDMATYQKNQAPYSYTTNGVHDQGGDPQFPSRYYWDYSYAQPHEVWEEYRGANGEQLVLDQQGNLRRFSSSSEIPESKAPLSEKELKARGEALLQALLPGSNVSAEHYSFTVGYQVAWEESDGSVYRSGTIYLNTSGDIWYIVNDCYVLQSVADTGSYDRSAYKLSETALDPAVPENAVEITDRLFIKLGGSIYGCYTLERTADTGIYVNYEIIDIQGEGQSASTETTPSGTEPAGGSGDRYSTAQIPAGTKLPDISEYDFSEYGIDTSALHADYYQTVDGTQEKLVVWSSEDGKVYLKTDAKGRIRGMGVVRDESDQPGVKGFQSRAEALFRKLSPDFDPEVTESSNDGRWSYSAMRRYETGSIDLFIAEFFSDGTLSFLQVEYAEG